MLYDPIAVKFFWEFSEFSELSEFSEFSFLALKIDFFAVKKIPKKMENRMSIIFEKNAKNEKIKSPLISVQKVFFRRRKKIKKIKIPNKIIFEKSEKLNKLF